MERCIWTCWSRLRRVAFRRYCICAGAIPAWISAHTQPAEVLHTEARLTGQTRSSKRLRGALVAFEVAVSVALVLTTGLLTASLARLMHTDRGFDADRTMTAQIDLPSQSYSTLQARHAFFKNAVDRLAALPGVEHAGLVSQLPLDGDRWVDMIRVNGDTRPAMQFPPSTSASSVPAILKPFTCR